MSDDWKPGDLALCVRGGFTAGTGGLRHYPEAGRPYTVSGVDPAHPFADGTTAGLILADGPINHRGARIWAAYRFRKINPLTEAQRETALREMNTPARENV